MNKPIYLILVLSSFFSLSIQYECTQYKNDQTCGLHTTPANIKCQNISSTCTEVELEEECQFNSTTLSCSFTGTDTTQKCFHIIDSITQMHKCKKIKVDNECSISISMPSTISCDNGNIGANEKCEFSDPTKQDYCKKMAKTCTDYEASPCGNIEKCFLLDGQSKCERVEVNSKCSISSDGKCVDGNSITNYEKCELDSSVSPKVCQPQTIPCLNIKKIDSCSNGKIQITGIEDVSKYKCLAALKADGDGACKQFIGNTQCTIDPDNNGECSLVDETSKTKTCKDIAPNGSQYKICYLYENEGSCSYDSENNKCVSSAEDKVCYEQMDEENYKFTCKERNKICSDQELESCKNIDSCYKINFYNYEDKCQTVTVDDHCTINTSTNLCEDTTETGKKLSDDEKKYKECTFIKDGDNIHCRPEYLPCRLIKDATKCQNGKTEDGYTCLKTGENSCDQFKVNSKCKINESNGNCEKNNINDENKDCKMDSSGNICRLYELEKDKCTASLENYYSDCNNGAPDNGKKCDLVENDDLTKSCVQVNKQCSDYKIETECEAATNIGQNKKCSWDKSKFIKCKEYTIDSHCTVTSGECKSGSSPPTGNNECLFGLEAGHTSECISREKICSNYNKDCETKVQITNTKQCISNGNVCQEISVDETCKIDNNECKFREATTQEKVGKCDYINVFDCKLRTRRCDEFSDSSKCNSVDYCHFSTKDRKCHPIEAPCGINDSNGECVGKGTLNENEVCDFISDTSVSSNKVCKKRNKRCNEIIDEAGSDANCIKYSPPETSKLCSYFINGNTCKEVEVRDGCSINQNGDCEGNSCKKEETATTFKCYREQSKNSQNYLNFSRIIILSLLFMF